jgi:hypothetical protein
MPTTPDNDAYRDGVRRLHDALAAPPEADVHQSAGGHGLYIGPQPGTTAFSAQYLSGSAAPEPVIERWGGIGSEGFGPVELLDGRTGAPIVRVNRHLRQRLS